MNYLAVAILIKQRQWLWWQWYLVQHFRFFQQLLYVVQRRQIIQRCLQRTIWQKILCWWIQSSAQFFNYYLSTCYDHDLFMGSPSSPHNNSVDILDKQTIWWYQCQPAFMIISKWWQQLSSLQQQIRCRSLLLWQNWRWQ